MLLCADLILFFSFFFLTQMKPVHCKKREYNHTSRKREREEAGNSVNLENKTIHGPREDPSSLIIDPSSKHLVSAPTISEVL
jgi:hypothetical protein